MNTLSRHSNNLVSITNNHRGQAKLDKNIISISLIFWLAQVLSHPVYSAYKGNVAVDIYTSFLHQNTPLGQCSNGNRKSVCLFSLCCSQFFLLSKGFSFLFMSFADQHSLLFFFAFVFSPLPTPKNFCFAPDIISKPFCSLKSLSEVQTLTLMQ